MAYHAYTAMDTRRLVDTKHVAVTQRHDSPYMRA